MAETPNVMPQLHMPLQSGSDKVLKDMSRSYRSTKFLGILDKVREQIPHAAISTDIIVGFPGETEEDFQATLDVVEKSRFATAFTFQYSKRPGTPAADLPDQLPKAVVQERFERLRGSQDGIAAEENQAARPPRRGHGAPRAGRKDAETHRLSGRSRTSGWCTSPPPDVDGPPRRPGRPSRSPTPPRSTWSPTARSTLRRSRAGDAWEARTAAPGPRRASALGMPTVGAARRRPLSRNREMRTWLGRAHADRVTVGGVVERPRWRRDAC